MKQIVDKLNKIAKKIDESVEIPQTDLIIDSLDAITKAYGGTPNDSNLIVDKLEDIYNNIGSGGGGDTGAYCTVKVTNDIGTTAAVLAINPENLMCYQASLDADESCNSVCFYYYDEEAQGYILVNLANIQDPQYPGLAVAGSNVTGLVNLEFLELYEGTGYLKVIDETLPSSCSMPLSQFMPH